MIIDFQCIPQKPKKHMVHLKKSISTTSNYLLGHFLSLWERDWISLEEPGKKCLQLKVTEIFTYPERKEIEQTLLPTSLSQALQTGYSTVSPRSSYTDFTNKEIETQRAQSEKKKKSKLLNQGLHH